MGSSVPVAWGIVGTGNMAVNFASALCEVENCALVAVASRSQARARAFADRFNIPQACTGYTELLTEAALDVVYIATPHATHCEISKACLERGKSVLCEKPFAINARQAGEVIELAREKKIFLMEAMWTRFVPAIEGLRALLSRQAIGDIQIMLAGGAYMPDFDPDYYLFDKALGGGILLDAGVYLVSLASMIFGKPEQVLATGQLGTTGVDEHEAILLTHRHGEIASLYISHRARSSPDLTLLGDRGSIYLHPPVFCPTGLTLSIDGEPDEVFDFPAPGQSYHHEIREVNRCLRAGLQESSLMPLDETRAVMETMDEIRRQLGLEYAEDR
jgi:predicted dehydrogenase